jgi:hypothetical protein
MICTSITISALGLSFRWMTWAMMSTICLVPRTTIELAAVLA